MANKFISVSYTLYTEDSNGREFGEEAPASAPFSFISGMGVTLKAFEDQIINLNAGDKFDFTIGVTDAYGPYVTDNLIKLPKSVFEIDGKFDEEHIQEGAIVPLMSADGQRFSASVNEILENEIELDLNHPLAGCNLIFMGEVLESREATAEELAQAAQALSGECGCGGGCGGGCSEEGCGGCGGCGGN